MRYSQRVPLDVGRVCILKEHLGSELYMHILCENERRGRHDRQFRTVPELMTVSSRNHSRRFRVVQAMEVMDVQSLAYVDIQVSTAMIRRSDTDQSSMTLWQSLTMSSKV